jgi:dihydroxyacetone kinase
VNDPTDFADEALDGMVAAYGRYLRRVHGGVVRATHVDEGTVAVVIGGGSGHYPAFAGWVGPGLAHGAACGNIFASPSASQVYPVLKAVDRGGGILTSFGNYAGDVLQFGQAADRIRADGVDVRILTVTDDVASAPPDAPHERRGIAGDLTVFKVAGAAAEAGADLEEVERLARRANDRTRSIGVAFSGCHLPGADKPLFTVPDGQMSVGLGIHGEPGIEDVPLASADEIAYLLVERVLAEDPGDSKRIAVLLNGLGTITHEELFVTARTVSRLLDDKGYTVVQPELGELCTSLDMAGLSLTVMWLDDDLERLWTAPCDTPAFRKGAVPGQVPATPDELSRAEQAEAIAAGSPASQAVARSIAAAIADVHRVLADNETSLGELDAVAGDGDHGIGMVRGARAADESVQESLAAGAGARTLLARAGDAWAERAGGTSGALWGAAIAAVARCLDDEATPSPDVMVRATSDAVEAVVSLGGAAVGDKTMVDAAVPFRDALAAASSGPSQAWADAVTAASEAAQATAGFAARRGRARTHTDKSIGTPDPGAVSFVTVVDVLGRHLGPNEP